MEKKHSNFLYVFGLLMDNAGNFGWNNNTVSIPSYNQAEACSMDNHQKIEDLFNDPVNNAKTQDVSTNSTSYTSKGINKCFNMLIL